MKTFEALRVVGILLLAGLLGGASVAAAPDGTHIGYMWPVGLATGALIWTRGRWQVLTAFAVVVLGALTFAAEANPLSLSLAYGLAIAAEAWFIERLLSRGGSYPLRDNDDVVRYALACGAGSAVGGLGFAAGSAITDVGVPWQVALAAFVTHVASQLTVVPFFLQCPPPLSLSGPRERMVRWAATLGMSVLAFVPEQFPTLAFLILPLIGWTAVRAPLAELLWMLVSVGALANVATQFRLGPFHAYIERGSLPTEILAIPQQAFLIGCALVSVPFAVAVRRQLESAREAATERSRTDLMLQSAQGLLIVGTDAFGIINLYGHGAQALLGYEPEEVYGKSPEMFHSAEEVRRKAVLFDCEPDFVSVIFAQLALPAGTPIDWEFVRADGARRTFTMILSPVLDENDEVTGYVATADDVTERVRVQEALENALATERRAVRRLQEVDRTKDSFVSTVSHELRTPITNIIGFLELLQDEMYGELEPPQLQALARVEANSSRLLGLIEDLLAMSQAQDVDRDDLHDSVDLNDVIDRVAKLAVTGAEPRDIRMAVDLPARRVEVIGDTGQLERLVSNLVSNAVKFTGNGGTVSVSLQDGVPGPVITVRDTGMGIPPDDLPRIFDRFFRSSNAQVGAVQGSGLGLSIVQSVAEGHGARVEVESEPGEGTLFRVIFGADGPVRVSETAGSAAPAETADEGWTEPEADPAVAPQR